MSSLKNIFRSLSFRIWLPFAGIISILLVSLLVIYPNRQETLLRRNIESELAQRTITTALGVSLALKYNDFEGLSNVIDLVESGDDLNYIAIIEKDSLGRKSVFVSNPPEYDPGKILAMDSIGFLIKSQSIFTEFLEGEVILAVPSAVIEKAIFQINYPVYVFTGILLIMSLGLFYVIAQHIASPVTYLTDISDKLKTGDFDIAIANISDIDEFSKLNNSFIELQEYLQKAKSQNDEFNLQLEEQILVRTRDLEITKNNLIEAQREAKLGNYEIGLSSGNWQSSPFIDQFFEIPDGLEKTNNSWMNFVEKSQADCLIQEFQKSQLLNLSFKKDFKILDKDSLTEGKWISIIGVPLFSPDLQELVIRGTIQDVSDRKAIEKEIEKLSLVAKRTSNGVFITDLKLKITWANESFLGISGYSMDELLGNTPKIFSFWKDESKLIREIERSLRQGLDVTTEVFNRDKEGNGVWLNVNIVPMREDSGETVGYMAVVVDITQLKDNENLIQSQFALQNILIDISSTYINVEIEDIGSTINSSLEKLGKFVNADRAHVFEYNFKDGISSNTHEWCGAGIVSEILNLQNIPISYFPDQLEKHISNKPFIVEDLGLLPEQEAGKLNVRKILETQGIQSLITIPFFEGAHLIGYVGFDSIKNKRAYSEEEIKLLTLFGQILLTVKQRQKVRKQMLLQEEKYTNIIANMHLGFLEVDTEDYIINANPSFCNMSKFSLEELVGKRGIDLFFEEEPVRKLVIQKNKIRRDGVSDVYEVEVIDKEKNKRHWLISGGPNYNENSELIGSIGLHLDVTDLKALEDEQKILLKLTQNQNNRLKNFAHIVSHNLRSHAANLSGMIGYLEVESKDFVENPFFQNFKSVIDNLMDSVVNLSEVADIQTNDLANLAKVNLVEIVKSSILNVSALAKASDITIQFESSLKKAWVMGDLMYLDSIVLNLLTNAIKYSDPKKEKTVLVTIEDSAEWIILRVKDNGLGIDLKRQGRKIFGMYKTFHEHADSRGIGLFITKNQVEALGGKINVKSQEGVGSIFEVYLKNK